MPSRRLERVAKEMLRELSRMVLGDVADPRVHGITVTRVEPSPDLRAAKVFFSVLGGPPEVEAALKGLRHARGFLQSLLGSRLKMRVTPELAFAHDPSIEGALRINQILKDLAKKRPPDAEPEPATEGGEGE